MRILLFILIAMSVSFLPLAEAAPSTSSSNPTFSPANASKVARCKKITVGTAVRKSVTPGSPMVCGANQVMVGIEQRTNFGTATVPNHWVTDIYYGGGYNYSPYIPAGSLQYKNNVPPVYIWCAPYTINPSQWKNGPCLSP